MLTFGLELVSSIVLSGIVLALVILRDLLVGKPVPKA